MKSKLHNIMQNIYTSHPARGAWIEITNSGSPSIVMRSHPARGAWIEIEGKMTASAAEAVAPRKGCVD